MDPLVVRQIGATDIAITRLGFGGGALGDAFEVTSDDQAAATLSTAWEYGINYYDTAPWYGNTKSERRVGAFLQCRPRDAYFLNTKVGRIYFEPSDLADFKANSPWMKRWKGGLPLDLRFDYTREGVMRSFEDSLQRLGLDRVDALTIHDLDLKHQKSEDGVAARFRELEQGGGWAALTELKARGEIRAIGVGINHVGMIPRFLERFPIDFFLVAMPYTLLDQDCLDEEFPLCRERGASVIVGAVFCSGILATGVQPGAKYGYQDADSEVVGRVKRMAAVGERHGVPLGAAATQFPLGHPVVASVIPGPNSPAQMEQIRAWFKHEIPADYWAELKAEGPLRADAPVPVA